MCTRRTGYLLAPLILTGAAAVATAAPAKRDDQILIQGLVAGSQTVAAQGTDSVRAEYSFNDRGRGDHIVATWRLDSAGVPIEYSGSDNDYMKAAVTESFRISGGNAIWRNRADHGEKAVTGEAFYIPSNAPPEFMGVLARALLKAPGHTLPLLPAGEARLTSVGSISLPGGGSSSAELTQYDITGLDFSPTPIWLDQDGSTAAALSGWFSVVSSTHVGSLGKLAAAQSAADSAWSTKLAQRLTHVPAGDLLIRNARLFDPRDLSVTPGTSVLVRNEHVVRIGPDSGLKTPAGADEIQHLNFIVLNFLFDRIKDTRGMTRFTAVAEHARELSADDVKVQEFIGFLKTHHTVLDPTMSVFESLFCGDPTAIVPGLETIVPRFPPQVRRNMLSGALAAPQGKEAAYREAFPAMLRLLNVLNGAGITIIPGTDALSGYTLLHELELYARAGIAPAQVLRMATLTSAQVAGVERERGTIAPGKLADMILIDGDPTAHIEDVRKIAVVIKGGHVYDPAQIETALGIAPRS